MSVTKTAKRQKAKKTENCSNLPTRCADAQRALRCVMTSLEPDHDGMTYNNDGQ